MIMVDLVQRLGLRQFQGYVVEPMPETKSRQSEAGARNHAEAGARGSFRSPHWVVDESEMTGLVASIFSQQSTATR